MASSREYLNFVMDQFSGLDSVTYRAMMGEFILYCRGKIFGGIYDDRLLVKPTAAARRLMPNAREELPYPAGRGMLLVERVDEKDFLRELVEAMLSELPEAKKNKGEKYVHRKGKSVF